MRQITIMIPSEIGFVGKNEDSLRKGLDEYLWNWFTIDSDDDEDSVNFDITIE